MNKIEKLIEKYFFKARVIFSTTEKIKPHKDIMANPELELLIVKQTNELLPKHRKALLEHIGKDKLNSRLSNPCITLYLAIYKETKAVAGYYCTAVPDQLPIWHDKVYVSPCSVLGLDAFTISAYRGKRVFPFLKAHAIHQHINKEGHKFFYSVVEISNKSSLQSNHRLGLNIVGKNYLIRFFKKNIISIIIIDNRWELHYVFRNAKSNSF